MPYLTQLATIARSTGYPVTEVAGWKTRGHGPQPEVLGVVAHHTAGATAGGDYPSLGVVRDGRAGLPGPLSHFGIGRSGRIYVVAAGRCWHNAPSTSGYHDNSSSIGIEAENDGRQPWPAVQLDAYRKLCAALCKEFGLSASRVKAHREVNTGKPDPHGVDMDDFRADVARLMKGSSVAITDADAAKIAKAVMDYKYNLSGDQTKDSLQGSLNFAEQGGPQIEEIFSRIGRIDDNVQAILSIVSGGPVIGGPE